MRSFSALKRPIVPSFAPSAELQVEYVKCEKIGKFSVTFRHLKGSMENALFRVSSKSRSQLNLNGFHQNYLSL